MSTQPNTFLTPEEYLAIERKADRKSEDVPGRDVGRMAGAGRRHNLIVVNIVAEFEATAEGAALRSLLQRHEEPVTPWVSIRTPMPRWFAASLSSPTIKKNTLLNPVVIVEVLSDSTRAYDRGRKFENYPASYPRSRNT